MEDNKDVKVIDGYKAICTINDIESIVVYADSFGLCNDVLRLPGVRIQLIYKGEEAMEVLDKVGFRLISSISDKPITIYGFTFMPGYTVIDMSKEGEIQDKFREYGKKNRLYIREHQKQEYIELEQNNITIRNYFHKNWSFHIWLNMGQNI